MQFAICLHLHGRETEGRAETETPDRGTASEVCRGGRE